MKPSKKLEYHGGKIKPLVEIVAHLVAVDPTLATEPDRLHVILRRQLEGYGKPDACYNCRRSMKITVYTADLLDALLMLHMARAVNANKAMGMSFTEANKVHMPTLMASQGILKRQTKCDYLGFIKQPDEWRGTGFWLMTAWGCRAVQNLPVPKEAHYWEGHLLRRSEEMTTLSQMFGTHKAIVERALAKRRSVRSDHRAEFADYHPSEWSDFAGNINELPVMAAAGHLL